VYPGVTDEQAGRLGKKLRKRFEKNIPALGLLSAAVREKARAHKSIKLIDGRRCPVRSEHAALNCLLQGTGAVICKRWIVHFSRRMVQLHGIPGWRAGIWSPLEWVHDEIGVAVRPDYAKAVSAIAISSIESITDHFHFRIPLTGEAKVGNSWAETH
jgi:DNA polymerase I-like protein with 3'-5' exonuclease and polymerase domains